MNSMIKDLRGMDEEEIAVDTITMRKSTYDKLFRKVVELECALSLQESRYDKGTLILCFNTPWLMKQVRELMNTNPEKFGKYSIEAPSYTDFTVGRILEEEEE